MFTDKILSSLSPRRYSKTENDLKSRNFKEFKEKIEKESLAHFIDKLIVPLPFMGSKGIKLEENFEHVCNDCSQWHIGEHCFYIPKLTHSHTLVVKYLKLLRRTRKLELRKDQLHEVAFGSLLAFLFQLLS